MPQKQKIAIIILMMRSLIGKKTPATGPTSNAHITVPAPNVPPKAPSCSDEANIHHYSNNSKLPFDFITQHHCYKVIGPRSCIGFDDDRHAVGKDDATNRKNQYPVCDMCLTQSKRC